MVSGCSPHLMDRGKGPSRLTERSLNQAPARPIRSGKGKSGGTGMKSGLFGFRSIRVAALLIAALSIGACARNPADQSAAMANASAATPGSQQDFVVNVGDRVFF